MLRTLGCAALILAVTFHAGRRPDTRSRAKTHRKIDGDTLEAFTVGGALEAKTEKGEAKTYDAAKDVKVYKMDKKTKVDVAGGLTAPDFTDLGKKGLNVTLEVNGDNKVTEITIGGKKKKTRHSHVRDDVSRPQTVGPRPSEQGRLQPKTRRSPLHGGGTAVADHIRPSFSRVHFPDRSASTHIAELDRIAGGPAA